MGAEAKKDIFLPSPLRSGMVVALRAQDGNLLDVGDDNAVRARWSRIHGELQMFTVEKVVEKVGDGLAIHGGDTVMFQAKHSQNYLDVGKDVQLKADFKDQDIWQKFVIVAPGQVTLGDAVCLTAHTGNNIDVEDGDSDGAHLAQARFKDCGGWQKLRIEEAPRPLQSGDAAFLRTRDGAAIAMRGDAGSLVQSVNIEEHGAGQALTVERAAGAGAGATSGGGAGVRLTTQEGLRLSVSRLGAENSSAGPVMFEETVYLRSSDGKYVKAAGKSASASGENRSKPEAFRVEQAHGGWILGDFAGSCAEACAAAGLVCDMQGMRGHLADVASPGGLQAVLERLQGTKCAAFDEKSGSESDVPAVEFLGGQAHCYVADGARSASTFSCAAAANKFLPRRRLCWCREPHSVPVASPHAAMSFGAAERQPELTMGLDKMCPGVITFEGHGNVSLVNTMWDKPGVPARIVERSGASTVMPHMFGRTYFAERCASGRHDRRDYLRLKLLGKTLRYTVSLRGAGCGCNAELLLTAMPQNRLVSGCNDYYCDASSSCGVACAEIDIQAANQHAWVSTLHAFDDPGGMSRGFGAGAINFDSKKYGLGGSCVDTSRPFEVSSSFPIGLDGNLMKVMVELTQQGSSCALTMSLDAYLPGRRKGGLAELTDALAEGMTPVIRYWGAASPGDMLWLDGGASGVCAGGQPATCSDTVRFYNFSVYDLDLAKMMQ